MFKGLSESRDFPPGKKLNSLSYSHRRHQLEMGDPSYDRPKQSAAHFLHDQKPLSIINRHQHEGRNHSHFQLRPEAYQPYYVSETSEKYKDKTGERDRDIKRLDKREIMKTTFVLGEEFGGYQTHNQRIFGQKDGHLPDIKWKPQRERYDIITNGELDQGKLKGACAFDFWTEGDKKRISRNYTPIPKENEFFDVITGRMRRIL